MDGTLAFIGTYTERGSAGIYVFRFDPDSGRMERLGCAAGVVNPSYLAVHPTRPYVYAVSEVGDFEGRPSGAVTAFSMDPKTGQPAFLNRRSSHGAAPCYLSMGPAGRFLFVANYGSGSAAVFPVSADGRLCEASDIVQHHGKSVDPVRQNGPHAHCIVADPAGLFVHVADLGLDRVMAYRFLPGKGRLVPEEGANWRSRPGAGPRHMTFHPVAPYVYVIHELDSTVSVVSYDSESGGGDARGTHVALPAGWRGTSQAADIHVHPGGNWLYVSNRGHDSIAVFEIDPRNGALHGVQHVPSGGRMPRSFGIDPSGRFLLVANQESDSLVCFRIDPSSGRLKRAGDPTTVSMPVCVKFVNVARWGAGVARLS